MYLAQRIERRSEPVDDRFESYQYTGESIEMRSYKRMKVHGVQSSEQMENSILCRAVMSFSIGA